MLPKEDRGPAPVEDELAGVQRHGLAQRVTLAALVGQVAGVPHARVQARPYRTEDPVGWTPGGLLHVFVPSLGCFIYTH